MNKNVFEFKSYKAFLTSVLAESTERWGLKSKLAEAMGCQPAYLSKVLNEQADLSQEQLLKAADFFKLTDDEKKFLLLIHQKDRAGTADLKKFYTSQIQEIQNHRLTLSNRVVNKNDLTEDQKSIYYSSWIYAAVHFAIGIETLQTREKLQEAFKINLKKLDAILKFLIESGLIEEKANRYKIKINHIFLGNNSPWIIRHHMAWRLRAIDNLDNEETDDLHYSGVYTLAEDDVQKIKDIMLEAIKKNVEVVRPSKEEVMYTCNIDFFKTIKK